MVQCIGKVVVPGSWYCIVVRWGCPRDMVQCIGEIWGDLGTWYFVVVM